MTAVSCQNLEIVQRGYEHFGATGEMLPEILHPDFVWDMSKFDGWPEQQTYAGLDGARQFIADWSEAWEDWELEVKDLLDAGDQVVAVMLQRGRARTTGMRVDMEFAMVWSFLEGQEIRMEMYARASDALEATRLQD
jgi:ketosteroid isomerase-like protein